MFSQIYHYYNSFLCICFVFYEKPNFLPYINFTHCDHVCFVTEFRHTCWCDFKSHECRGYQSLPGIHITPVRDWKRPRIVFMKTTEL